MANTNKSLYISERSNRLLPFLLQVSCLLFFAVIIFNNVTAKVKKIYLISQAISICITNEKQALCEPPSARKTSTHTHTYRANTYQLNTAFLPYPGMHIRKCTATHTTSHISPLNSMEDICRCVHSIANISHRQI